MTVENKVTDYVRQIIVVRKDLGMPTGKVAAMAAHASMTFIARRLKNISFETVGADDGYYGGLLLAQFAGLFTEEQRIWLTQLEPGSEHQLSFAKIVCEVWSRDELQEVYNNAIDAGLECHEVIDSGYSHNPPDTFTCIAVGPHFPERLKPVTGKLPIYR